ncbi:MAG TPA: hypothetical protein PK950_02610 [Candidatus Paceibacterota bacterium]|nr:hypothetical protein [Candidatus Paceibacterota bacterium]
MKKNGNIKLVYVCARNEFELAKFIEKLYPFIADEMAKVSNSVDAISAVSETGPVTVLTSNLFHASPYNKGADGKDEREMTGEKLATLIKQRNRDAKVYMHAQHLEESPIFDGYFQRNMKDGFPNDELRELLNDLNIKSKESMRSGVLNKLCLDFDKNFITNKLIKESLTFEEMSEFYKDPQAYEYLGSDWKFAFYCKQVFLTSFAKLLEELPKKMVLDMLQTLRDLDRQSEDNEGRAIIECVMVTNFCKAMSNLQLIKLIDESIISDEHCAQLAYEEYTYRRQAG